MDTNLIIYVLLAISLSAFILAIIFRRPIKEVKGITSRDILGFLVPFVLVFASILIVCSVMDAALPILRVVGLSVASGITASILLSLLDILRERKRNREHHVTT